MEFKETFDGEYPAGKLDINLRKNEATCFLPIPLTDYPQVIAKILSQKEVPIADVRKLCDFFTTLTTT